MTRRILVVDDEPDVLAVTGYRLRKAGYKVATAPDGQGALDEMRRSRPDLVLLDLRMPGMDGIDVCRHIRQDENLKDVPVILLTASSDSIAREQVRQAESDGLLLKPCDLTVLLDTVQRLLEQTRANEKQQECIVVSVTTKGGQ